MHLMYIDARYIMNVEKIQDTPYFIFPIEFY